MTRESTSRPRGRCRPGAAATAGIAERQVLREGDPGAIQGPKTAQSDDGRKDDNATWTLAGTPAVDVANAPAPAHSGHPAEADARVDQLRRSRR